MTNQVLKVTIAAVLLLHGFGHLGAMGGIFYHQARNSTGDWLSDRSWLIPSMDPQTARTVAIVFWVVAATGFVLTALGFWGVSVLASSWQWIAVVSAIVSTVGIVLFFGTWPIANTLAALGINVAVLVTQLWMDWPAQEFFTS
jgi:hypothetical protein